MVDSLLCLSTFYLIFLHLQDFEIHRIFRLFHGNAEKRSVILLDISKLLHDSFSLILNLLYFYSCYLDSVEKEAGDIVELLVEEGIYDVLSEAFEKETDDTLLVYLFTFPLIFTFSHTLIFCVSAEDRMYCECTADRDAFV